MFKVDIQRIPILISMTWQKNYKEKKEVVLEKVILDVHVPKIATN
jgi:hypothetical protein